MTQPSGTSQGDAKTRHSFVSGLRAGDVTATHAIGAAAATSTPVNFPSGRRTLTAPDASGMLLVIRSDPMKSAGALGRSSGTKRLMRPCGGIVNVPLATNFPLKSISDKNTVAVSEVDGFTKA